MFVPSFPTLGGKAVPINELLSDEGTQANTSPCKKGSKKFSWRWVGQKGEEESFSEAAGDLTKCRALPSPFQVRRAEDHFRFLAQPLFRTTALLPRREGGRKVIKQSQRLR